MFTITLICLFRSNFAGDYQCLYVNLAIMFDTLLVYTNVGHCYSTHTIRTEVKVQTIFFSKFIHRNIHIHVQLEEVL
jgi:hypothetical protein